MSGSIKGSITTYYAFRPMYIDHANLTRKVNQVDKLFKDGAHKYLDVINRQVPVWSGMAKAAFLPLAKAIGHHLYVAQKRQSILKGGKSRRIQSRTQLGKTKGQYFVGLHKGLTWNFYFKTDVAHHNRNDQVDTRKWGFRLKSNPPWYSMETATEVYKKHVRMLAKKVKRKMTPSTKEKTLMFTDFIWTQHDPKFNSMFVGKAASARSGLKENKKFREWISGAQKMYGSTQGFK